MEAAKRLVNNTLGVTGRHEKKEAVAKKREGRDNRCYAYSERAGGASNSTQPNDLTPN